MIGGDPFRTSELEDLRSEQRRVLLSLRDGSVGAGLREVRTWSELAHDPPDFPPAALEWGLRRFLESRLERHRYLIDGLGRELERKLVHQACRPVENLLAQTGIQIQTPEDFHVEHRDVVTLAGLAGLLVCAELLADDGWAGDPRLRALTASGSERS